MKVVHKIKGTIYILRQEHIDELKAKEANLTEIIKKLRARLIALNHILQRKANKYGYVYYTEGDLAHMRRTTSELLSTVNLRKRDTVWTKAGVRMPVDRFVLDTDNENDDEDTENDNTTGEQE